MNTINLIKINILKKKKKLEIPYTKNNLKYIKFFLKINILKNFLIKNKKLICFINFIKSKSIIKNITLVNIKLNKKNVNKLIKNNSALFIFNTQFGLLNQFELKKLKTFGILKFKINF
jgi:hypothetical protein